MVKPDVYPSPRPGLQVNLYVWLSSPLLEQESLWIGAGPVGAMLVAPLGCTPAQARIEGVSPQENVGVWHIVRK